MKKNYFMYIVVFLVLFFGSNVNVNAAALTCLYENGTLADKVMLVQQADGILKVYKHDKDAGIDDDGWYISKAKPKWGVVGDSTEWIDDDDKAIQNGELTECPKSMKTLKNGKGKIRFYDTENGGDRKLEDSEEEEVVPLNIDNTMHSIHGSTSCSNISDEDKWITPYEEGGDYIASCLYEEDVSGTDDVLGGCHIIQINIDKEFKIHYKQVEPVEFSVDYNPYYEFNLNSDSLNINAIKESLSGECPPFITVKRDAYSSSALVFGEATAYVKTEISLKGKGLGTDNYVRIDYAGFNIADPTKRLNGDVVMGFEKIDITDCNQLFDGNDELISMLNTLIDIVFKILIPILLIVFGSLDFVKVVFSGKEDSMKKAQTTFIKRLVIAVVIFLLPIVLKLILSIANGIWGNIDPTFCGIL